jgi:hypothetical protein
VPTIASRNTGITSQAFKFILRIFNPPKIVNIYNVHIAQKFHSDAHKKPHKGNYMSAPPFNSTAAEM